MKNRNILFIAGFVLIIAALVLFRSMDQSHFRNDLSKWAEPTLSKRNFVTEANLVNIEKPLFVQLDNTGENPGVKGNVVIVLPEDILKKENIEKIRDYKGPVILVSQKPDVSAKVWMILSQMGIENLYLLADLKNEEFRYEFRPDTTARPEI